MLVVFISSGYHVSGQDNPSLGAMNGTSCGTVDYGGKIYNTVIIGNQCWLTENLDIGTMIPGSQPQSGGLPIEKYCWGNIPANCIVYGGLYQWDEMMLGSTTPGAQGICPGGWHLPDDTEWNVLFGFLGGTSVAGGKMKEAGTSHWFSPNTNATNESGFTALPGGNNDSNGSSFYSLGYSGFIWSSTRGIDWATSWVLQHVSAGVIQSARNPASGISVRCLKDPPTTLTIQDDTVYNLEVVCYDATLTVTVAGSNTSFTVENGGSATIISGGTIHFLPASIVNPGGYLHAYITETGQYCSSTPNPLTQNTPSMDSKPIGIDAYINGELNFKVYPNPTPGRFTVELSGELEIHRAEVTIYGMRGEKILQEVMQDELRREFSIEDAPVGIYHIHLFTGTNSTVCKLIKL